MRHVDSSPSIPPRFVAFARRYHPSTCSFAPSGRQVLRPRRSGLGERAVTPPTRRSLRAPCDGLRRRGLPGSRETPRQTQRPCHWRSRWTPYAEVAASTAV